VSGKKEELLTAFRMSERKSFHPENENEIFKGMLTFFL
jgi:hypothetical protein